MRHIMVLNAKGGCGKSTLATNIASYFANEGANVALADYDPVVEAGRHGVDRHECRTVSAGIELGKSRGQMLHPFPRARCRAS